MYFYENVKGKNNDVLLYLFKIKICRRKNNVTLSESFQVRGLFGEREFTCTHLLSHVCDWRTIAGNNFPLILVTSLTGEQRTASLTFFEISPRNQSLTGTSRREIVYADPIAPNHSTTPTSW